MADLEALSKTALAALTDYLEAVGRRAGVAARLRDADREANSARTALQNADTECERMRGGWEAALRKVEAAAGWDSAAKIRGEAR